MMNFAKCLSLILLITSLSSHHQAHAKGTQTWINILDLHPTQIPIGLLLAKRKAQKYARMSKIETIKYLINNPVPVVVGPGKKLYMVDHHHLCFAFDLIGQKEVVYKIIGDLSDSKTPLEFWSKMINEGNIYGDYKWAYDHDENGNKLSVNEFIRQIGSTIRVMRDDPFRSIAGRLRDSGDYTKQPTDYFIEFVIANYLRSIISYKKRDSWYDKAFKKGEKILNSTLGNTRKCSKIMETLSAY